MLKIIDETTDYLVIEKPAGLLVHTAPGKTETTLADELLAQYPAIASVGDSVERPGIVHRLDRDVSGLMVVAKSQPMFLSLKRQFKRHTVLKEYTALVHGVLTPSQEHGIIEKPIGRSHTGRGRMAAYSQAQSDSREAKTEYWIITRLRHHTLLRVRIYTGRSHQIRVHLFALGYPVVGDKVYQQKRIKPAKIERLFLHSTKLGFKDLAKQYHEYESELPKELQNFLTTLK